MKIMVSSDDLQFRAEDWELCDDQAIDHRSLVLANNVDSIHYYCPFYRLCSRSIIEWIAGINMLFALLSTPVGLSALVGR
jgi:hypothetical protein